MVFFIYKQVSSVRYELNNEKKYLNEFQALMNHVTQVNQAKHKYFNDNTINSSTHSPTCHLQYLLNSHLEHRFYDPYFTQGHKTLVGIFFIKESTLIML